MAHRRLRSSRQANPDTTTLLLAGAGLVGAFFLFRGKAAAAAGLPQTEPPAPDAVTTETPAAVVVETPAAVAAVETPDGAAAVAAELAASAAATTTPIVTPDGAGAVVAAEKAQVEPTPPAPPATPDAPIIPSAPPTPQPPIVVQVDHKPPKQAGRLRVSSKGPAGKLVVNGQVKPLPVPSAPVSITYDFQLAPVRLAIQYPTGQRSATIFVTPAKGVVKQVIFESPKPRPQLSAPTQLHPGQDDPGHLPSATWRGRPMGLARLSSMGPQQGTLILNGKDYAAVVVPTHPGYAMYSLPAGTQLDLAIRYSTGEKSNSRSIVLPPSRRGSFESVEFYPNPTRPPKPPGTGGYTPPPPLIGGNKTNGGSLPVPSSFVSKTPAGSGSLPAPTIYKAV
jgi:hypothetical protein